MSSGSKPPRQAIRRSLSWPARVIISIAIPLACGTLVASTGLPRRAYDDAWRFWELTGLYDARLIQKPARPAHKQRDNMSKSLRYISEGVIYAALIIPAFILAIFIYDRLTFRYSRDGYLRCLGCGHILQGLSEPRCTECGRAI